MNPLKKAKEIINHLENPQIPLLNYCLIFFSSITLRTFLEMFSDRAKLPLKFQPYTGFLYLPVWLSLGITLMHYYAFWIALFLAIAIVFFALTKEEIIKILKLVFCASIILNITPLFDLIISAGKGFNIRYVYPETLAGFLPVPNSLTSGMMLTSITGILSAFFYCWIKTHNFLKGLAGALGLYFTLMLTSILPFILKAHHPVPIIRVLLIGVCVELLAIFYLWRRDYFLAMLKDARLLRIIHFYLMLFLGVVLSGGKILWVLEKDLSAFLLLLISTTLCWISAVMFNNLEDFNIDKISNAARPLVLGTIPKEDYKRLGLFISALALGLGLGVNFQTFFFCLLMMGNSFIYSLPPLRFKRIPIFSKIFISLNSLLAVMLGFIFAGGELLNFPWVVSWYFLVFVTLAMNFIDLKDYEGDKAEGILTLPVMLGLKKAKLVIGAFFLLAYGMLCFVFLDLRLFLPAVLLGVVQFFLINKKTYEEKWVLILYLISFLSLLINR